MLLLYDQVGSTNNVSIVLARLVEYGVAEHDGCYTRPHCRCSGRIRNRRTAVHPRRPILGAA